MFEKLYRIGIINIAKEIILYAKIHKREQSGINLQTIPKTNFRLVKPIKTISKTLSETSNFTKTNENLE